MTGIDDPARGGEIRSRITSKPSLRHFYERVYSKYRECLARCPTEGLAVEIGSGGGFTKLFVPEMLTSDLLPYEGIDGVIDATKLPFSDSSVRFICMLNVFHHIPKVDLFLSEAQRCLMAGGRLLIVDQHVGVLSRPILKYFHHEPFDEDVKSWRFSSSGPLSGANGALTWIVFVRDVDNFRAYWPSLSLLRYKPHTPFSYWLTGGLKNWNLLPSWMLPTMDKMEESLVRRFPALGSFVDVEIVKTRSACGRVEKFARQGGRVPGNNKV